MTGAGTRARAASDLEVGSHGITDHEFGLLRELVQSETGIQLPDTKRPLLVGRLARRLRELELDSFGAYYLRVTRDGDQAERIRMIDLISTNETHFFREPKQFEFLARTLIPRWVAEADAGLRPRSLSVWSAACSSGDEPFSVAMALLDQLSGWKLDILATDISTRILEKARAAVWPIERSREIPEHHLRAFMLRGVGASQGTMKAGAELRRAVRFERLNLHDPRWEIARQFDLVLCRNVLIYFSTEGRATVVRRLIDRLGPCGYLFLGHAETLNGIDDQLRSSGPSIYSRPAGRSRR